MTSRLACLALAAMLSTSPVSCGSPPSRDPVSRKELEPAWEDAFAAAPDLYLVVRPQAIRRDAVYGGLFRTALRMAQAQRAMRGPTTLEAIEGADELVVGVSLATDASTEDMAVVVRGVPGHLDPAKVVDERGRPLLRRIDAPTRVVEYGIENSESGISGGLFLLPDRTWVAALGAARARARQRFASPSGRVLGVTRDTDRQALASMRVDARSSVIRKVVGTNRIFGPLTTKLDALTVRLMPGKAGVVIQLQYEDNDASAWAHMQVLRIVEEYAQADPTEGALSSAWLKSAVIRVDGSSIVARVAVPARLLEDLPDVTFRDLDF